MQPSVNGQGPALDRVGAPISLACFLPSRDAPTDMKNAEIMLADPPFRPLTD